MFKWKFPNRIRREQIIRLATPIVLGMLSINILDIVDTAMIGRLGDKALAGTGFASFLFFVSFSMTVGIAASVQTLTARRLGENKMIECGNPLNAGLLLVGIYGLFIGIVMSLVAPYILGLFSSDLEVLRFANDYYLWRLPGILAIGVSLCFRGFWNGIKAPNTYTIILVVTHTLNILLNWMLIFGHLGFPALGVKGAAMGSTISLYIGMFAYIFVTRFKKASMGVLQSFPKPSVFRSLFRLGTPSAIDQWLFSLFLLGMFWILGQIGTEAAAVGHVVIICILLLYLPGVGLGMTSLSLVSEALGRGDSKDAKQWAWDIIKLGVPFITLTSFIFFCFPKPILMFFIHTKSTLELAVFPFRVDLLMMGSLCIGVIFLESLVGAGATRVIMIIKLIFRYGFLLPGAYILAVPLKYGINEVWMYWTFVTFIETLIFIWIWTRGRWAKIRI
jgi:multidrug resistance protein, MATE family